MQNTQDTTAPKRVYRLSAAGLVLLSFCLAAPAWSQQVERDVAEQVAQDTQNVAPQDVEQDAQQEAAQGSTPDEEEALVPEIDVLAIRAELNARLEAIEDLQSEFGVYSPVLVEAYSDFGAYYTEIGDLDSAGEMYNSALQIERITNGLYSEQQLPVLEHMIENNVLRRDWEKVDDLHHLSFHISDRIFPLEDARFLTAAVDYSEWKQRVVRENLLDLGSRGLINETEQLSSFYERVIEGLEFNTETRQEDLLQMIYGKSVADMSLARVMATTPYTYFQGTVSQYVNQTRCQNVRDSSGQIVRQCYSVQVENPRYRQSQQDAKTLAVSQYVREIGRSIDKLQAIADQSTDLSAQQREELEMHVGELQTESIQLQRAARRRSFF